MRNLFLWPTLPPRKITHTHKLQLADKCAPGIIEGYKDIKFRETSHPSAEDNFNRWRTMEPEALARFAEFIKLDVADLKNVSGQLVFGLVTREEVAELSGGFEHSGQDRYINPKLLRKCDSGIIEDGAQSRRRTCRVGLGIPSRPLTPARRDLYYVARHGALNATSQDGSTALMMAAEAGNMVFIHYLLDAGANPYKSDRRGNTALHYAAQMNHVSIVALLLSVGCDPFKINEIGHDAEKTGEIAGASTSMLSLLQGGKALWLRVSRGASITHSCRATGTRCELTHGTQAESLVSRVSGLCAYCGRSETPCHTDLEHWPRKADTHGLNCDDRYATMELRERELRLDADVLRFWLRRSMRPLDHLELADVNPSRVLTNEWQTKASGYPGSWIARFDVSVEQVLEEAPKKHLSKDDEEDGETLKQKAQREKREKKEAAIRQRRMLNRGAHTVLKVTRVARKSTELPRGWRCLSFVFRDSGTTQRVRKNPDKQGLADRAFIHITANITLEEAELKVKRARERRTSRRSISRRFRTRVKALSAKSSFVEAGTARREVFRANEVEVFGTMPAEGKNTNADNKSTVTKASLMRIAAKARAKAKVITHTVAVPVHSNSVIITKSGKLGE